MVFDYKDQLKTGEFLLSTWPSVPGTFRICLFLHFLLFKNTLHVCSLFRSAWQHTFENVEITVVVKSSEAGLRVCSLWLKSTDFIFLCSLEERLHKHELSLLEIGVKFKHVLTERLKASTKWHSSCMTFLSQMTKVTCWTRWEQSRRTPMWIALQGFSFVSPISGHILSITLHLIRYLSSKYYIWVHPEIFICITVSKNLNLFSDKWHGEEWWCNNCH